MSKNIELPAISSNRQFRMRRFMNWFPLGFAYALLYMGRYNLTVAKNSLGDLMTKEDFGVIFAAGTAVYAISFLINGPIVDKIGGRKGMLIALVGSATANALMALYLISVLGASTPEDFSLRMVFIFLYAMNMYFQSFAAVSIVKVNAHWFHVGERGGFSGIFGTMISSGIFFAFTGNALLLDMAKVFYPQSQLTWVVFAAPAILLICIFVVEFIFLRDRPGLAGFEDFDTGDASSGEDEKPIPSMVILKKIFTNPIILTIAGVEFCTGVLRNGVMHWFPIYAKEILVLPGSHSLMYGPLKSIILAPISAMFCGEGNQYADTLCREPVASQTWIYFWTFVGSLVVSVVFALLARKASGKKKVVLILSAVFCFLAPFFPMGWGGMLFVAGVLGGNIAGWVSDLFFQSRRAPAAGGLYAILAVSSVIMLFVLGQPKNVVDSAPKVTGLMQNDVIVAVDGFSGLESWQDVAKAIRCHPAQCLDSRWDSESCKCSSNYKGEIVNSISADLTMKILRDGQEMIINVADSNPKMRAGEKRKMKIRPVLPLSPWLLGMVIFLMSLCVIGTHGLLSGTATMDFGGRKAAATTVGMIDGFVYAGTALQSITLGWLTGVSWSYWPVFLFPFSIIGVILLRRIWNATAQSAK